MRRGYRNHLLGKSLQSVRLPAVAPRQPYYCCQHHCRSPRNLLPLLQIILPCLIPFSICFSLFEISFSIHSLSTCCPHHTAVMLNRYARLCKVYVKWSGFKQKFRRSTRENGGAMVFSSFSDTLCHKIKNPYRFQPVRIFILFLLWPLPDHASHKGQEQ